MQINWEEYLTNIYSLADITVPSTERVIVTETEYLKKLVALLDVTPTRTIGRLNCNILYKWVTNCDLSFSELHSLAIRQGFGRLHHSANDRFSFRLLQRFVRH